MNLAKIEYKDELKQVRNKSESEDDSDEYHLVTGLCRLYDLTSYFEELSDILRVTYYSKNTSEIYKLGINFMSKIDYTYIYAYKKDDNFNFIYKFLFEDNKKLFCNHPDFKKIVSS